jgi:hypothetical protein
VKIPYYRCVRDSDDGCGIYQCLHCGETWEWRGGSAKVRFCLFCGTPVEKRETRDQETPHWLYDLEKRSRDNWPEVRARMWREDWEKRDRRPAPPDWVIDERTFVIDKEGEQPRLLTDWKFKQRLSPQPSSAHQAFAELLRFRHQEAIRDTPEDPDYDPDDFWPGPVYRYEFRLRRVRA